MEDTTVLVVGKLGLGIDSDLSLEFLSVTSGDVEDLANLEFTSMSRNVESLLSGEAERFSVLSGKELKREHAHAD